MVVQNMSRTYDIKYVLSDFFLGFDDSFDVNKCLHQLEIPSYINTICMTDRLNASLQPREREREGEREKERERDGSRGKFVFHLCVIVSFRE